MKKLLTIALLSIIFSCSKDIESDNLSNDGRLAISLNLLREFNFELDTSSNKTSVLEDSDFAHVFDEEITVTFTSVPPGYSQRLSFNPNDGGSDQTVVLPYGEYNWEIPNESNPVALSNSLTVYGQSTQTITINDPTVNLSLDVNTDYALVTVNDDYTTTVTLTHDNLSISMNNKDGYYYGYVLSGTTSTTLEVVDTNGDNYISDLGLTESCKHYKYQLNYSTVGVNSLICLCDPFEVIERFLIPNNNTPPNSPSFYYDATNTNFSSSTSFKDIITNDDRFQFNETGGSSSSFPTYVSGKYYQFSPNNGCTSYQCGGNNMRQDSSGSTSDDLNTLASTSHTIFSVINLGSTQEEDTFTNGITSGGVLLEVYNNRVRGHVWSPNEVSLDHSNSSLQTDVWYIIGQRWDVTNGKIDVFLATQNGTVDIDEGTTNTVNPPSAGPSLMGIDARGNRNGYGDFKLNQGVIYRTNLSDDEIQEVCNYLSSKIPTS